MKPKIVVIKYGGAAQQTPSLIKATMEDIVHLKKLGMCPIIVHGGGPEISKMCQKLGITPVFVKGLRVTDKETLEVVQMVLGGKINQELVLLLNQEGGNAVGLSGLDGNLLLAKQTDANLGFVGEVEKVNPAILFTLIQAGYIPVISPIASSFDSQSYNVNADSAAAAIAIELNASHLVLLTDVPGVLECIEDPSTKIEKIKSCEINALIESGKLKGGMIPKIKGALSAILGGVEQVHILDGRAPHSLLLHFQGIETQGTTIYV